MVNLIWHECGILFMISHRFSAASASQHVDLNPPSLHTLALSPSFLPSFLPSFPFSCLPSLCLRDVGYGVADFQTPPVDRPHHGKQSEEDQKHPRNVDPFRALSRRPCTDLKSETDGGHFNNNNLVGLSFNVLLTSDSIQKKKEFF